MFVVDNRFVQKLRFVLARVGEAEGSLKSSSTKTFGICGDGQKFATLPPSKMDPYKLARIQMLITTYAAEMVSQLTGEDHAIDNVAILPKGTVCVTTTTKGEPVMAAHAPLVFNPGEAAREGRLTTFEASAEVVPLFHHTTMFFIPEAVTVMAVHPLVQGATSQEGCEQAGTNAIVRWKRSDTTAWHKQPIFERQEEGRPTPRFYLDLQSKADRPRFFSTPQLTETGAHPVHPATALYDFTTRNVVVATGLPPAWAADALHQFLPIPVLVFGPGPGHTQPTRGSPRSNFIKFHFVKPSGQDT